jgi:hypothetical protein
MRPSVPSGISLTQFTTAFVSFGILLSAALIWPENTEALDLGRTKATILAASTLLIPAFALYPFVGLSPRVANLARLFWTFAYLTFLVHAWWAVFIIFHGIADTFKEMGTMIAGMNFLLIIWWGIEVVLLWTVRHSAHRFGAFQVATRIYVFLVFALTLLVLRATAPARALGVALVIATLAAMAIGYWASERTDPQRAGMTV